MSLSAAEALDLETTVAGVLKTTCVQLTDALEADGCTLSRVVGQLLIDLVSHARDGRRMQLGRSYLLSDYPLTDEVVSTLEERVASLRDPAVDPGEAALLRELDFEELLMLPLVLEGRCWALVEIYLAGERGFSNAEIATGVVIVAQAAEAIERLQRGAAAA